MAAKEKEIFRLAEIISRSIRGEISGEEQEALERWLAEDEHHRTLYASFQTEKFLETRTLLREELDWRGDCRRFLLRRKANRRRSLVIRWSRYAAVLLLLLSVGLYRFVQSRQPATDEMVEELASIRHKALLTLEGGEKIVLTDLNTHQSESQRGASIEIKDDRITYSGEDTFKEDVPCNSLETPRGGMYTIVLADGTRVWLNAESRLRYPVKFTGKRRTVYLSGEAYFDVQPDAGHPFTIISGSTEITVLGTSFNLRAYPEGDVITTLVSGSVQMSEEVGGQSVRLAPGEQGIFSESDGKMRKQTVDPYLYTAWKSGRIVFRDMRLEELFANLARWYDLEVFYLQPAVKDIRFTGDIDRMESFHEILRIIEQNRRVHFSVKNRTVIITLRENE